MPKLATLSAKNQVTIPREVRDLLGLKVGTTIVFHIVNDSHGPTVTLRRANSLEGLAGSVPTPEDVEALSWEEIRLHAWAGTPDSTDESPVGT
jgi:AbrB family looped-hinge helix DNA binding protein